MNVCIALCPLYCEKGGITVDTNPSTAGEDVADSVSTVVHAGAVQNVSLPSIRRDRALQFSHRKRDDTENTYHIYLRVDSYFLRY